MFLLKAKKYKENPVLDSKCGFIFWSASSYLVKSWFVISFLYLHYYIVKMFFNIYSVGFSWFMFEMIAYNISNLFNFYWILFKRKQIRQVLDKLSESSVLLSVTSKRRFLLRTRVLIVLYTTFSAAVICGFSLLPVLMYSIVPVDQNLYEIFLGTTKTYLTFSSSLKCLILVLDKLIFSIAIVISGVVFTLLGNTFALYLEEHVQYLLSILKQTQASFDGVKKSVFLVAIGKEYRRIRSLIQDMDDVSAYPVFLWYCSYTTTGCAGLISVVLFGDKYWPMVYVITSALHFQSLFTLIVFTLVASRIPSVCDEAIDVIQRLPTSENDKDASTTSMILLTQMTNPPLGLTAGGCFYITKNFCVSFISVVLTYTVLVVQLVPGFMTKLNN